ncbi:uncharacterized protein CELE_Y7A5A.5 [Caenorhabditis elegans]|uniref:Uncharacterized protein n=1 Tax=Caenorhabditis elegans TaxID=6239 RepID=Q9XVY9_CAEEL|nr:Uncharacterized protein CELE_Y7A5A.5 [Caenorhabditis elegans]CAA22465.2 Uncharacterized protein CELE_Y7A5A.5 [Caenorhabditis elegans]
MERDMAKYGLMLIGGDAAKTRLLFLTVSFFQFYKIGDATGDPKILNHDTRQSKWTTRDDSRKPGK